MILLWTFGYSLAFMALRLILFDFDDTLFDHRATVEASFAKMQRLHPFLHSKPLASIVEVYHESLETMHPDILAGKLTLEQGRAKRFHDVAKHCGTVLCDEEALSLAKEYRRIYCDSEIPSEGAIDLLQYCSERFTIGVVTNNMREEQETRARSLGIDQYIDFMVTYEDTNAMKPDPIMLRIALDRCSVTASEAVLVGDSLATDVEAAIRIDMRCIWLCSNEDYVKKGRPSPLRTIRIEKLIEAIPILDELG